LGEMATWSIGGRSDSAKPGLVRNSRRRLSSNVLVVLDWNSPSTQWKVQSSILSDFSQGCAGLSGGSPAKDSSLLSIATGVTTMAVMVTTRTRSSTRMSIMIATAIKSCKGKEGNAP
jgi:hypothetical protein